MRKENGILMSVQPEDLELLNSNPDEFWRGVESIGEAAFYGCTSLTDISVPDSLNYTEVGAFDENSKLNLNLYGNAYYLGNKNNPYVILLKPVNNQISSCEIHENTKVIYNLSGCNSLESLTIPNKVQTICSSAFA